MKTFTYDKVPLKIKFYGGFGAFGINLTTGLFLTWTQIFYIEMIKINPLMWVLAWIIYFIWNALNDPIFGHISDKTRTKYGRRIPYLMLCGPLLSISFICIYFVPTYSSDLVKFFWLLISLLIYDSFFTMVSLCFSSLLAELSINPEERAIINIFSGLGAGIAVALTYALPILFIFFDSLPLNQEIFSFQIIALLLAIFGALFLAFTAFGVKERRELLPEKEETLGLWRAIKNVLSNKSFITYVIFNFTMAYVLFSVNSNLPFYLEYVLDISLENIISSTPLL
ncbi:MAG: MFS transporter, partial [Promethearchaeota archaeon]